MMPSVRRWLGRLAVPSMLIVGATCSDSGVTQNPTPGTRHATVVVTIGLPAANTPAAGVYQAANLTVDRVRVLVVRAPSEILKDTTVLATAAQAPPTVRLDVDAANGEPLNAATELRSGSTVLYAGQASV